MDLYGHVYHCSIMSLATYHLCEEHVKCKHHWLTEHWMWAEVSFYSGNTMANYVHKDITAEALSSHVARLGRMEGKIAEA